MNIKQTLILVVEKAARIPLYIGSMVALAMVFLTVGDVIGRYFFNSPIAGATELTRLGMAVIIFTALPIISARGEHISVDLLDGLYSTKVARYRDATIDILFGLGLIYLLPRFNIFAQRVMTYGEYTEYLQIPLFYVNYFILFWVSITALVLLSRGLLKMFNVKKPTDKVPHNEIL